MKEVKGSENAVRGKGFEARSPIVPSSPINEDECVAEATNRKAITKGNVHVNGVQIAVAGSIKEFAPLGFRDSGKRAKGGRELTAVNPFAISTHV